MVTSQYEEVAVHAIIEPAMPWNKIATIFLSHLTFYVALKQVTTDRDKGEYDGYKQSHPP